MIDPACSKRAQEPGPNDQSHSLEAPPFLSEASAGAGAKWRTLLIRSPLFHALSAVCPYSSPYQDGKCPLMVAFEKQLFEIVQLLIAAGANVNVSDKVSST